MLTRLQAAWAWIYDFVVGDDWRLAVAAIAAIALTAVVHAAGAPAWPIAPAVVLVVIVWSTAHAMPRRR